MKKHLARISRLLHRLPPQGRVVLRRVARRTLHVTWYGVAVVGLLLAIAFAAARVFLPGVEEKKAELEALLSRQSGYDVRIDQLSAYWDGLHPGLKIDGIGVFAPQTQRPAVRLAELRISLKILPLLIGRLEIHSAVLKQPTLTLERLVDGRFRISGLDPIGQVDAAQNEAFIGWLFRQEQISVEDGELRWFDRRESGQPPRLTHVNLQLRNDGDRHRLGLAADFPEGVCGACSFAADIIGNPFGGEGFDGRIYVGARDVDVARMPRVLAEHLPAALRGTFSAELWSDWEDSQPTAVDGDVTVAGLRLPLTGLRAPLSVKQATTRLHWKRKGDGFQAKLDDVTLALHGAPWSAGSWEFVRGKDETSLRIGRIELADVTAFIASLRPAGSKETLAYEEAAAWWTTLQPSGAVNDLRIALKGALDAPERYSLSAHVDNLNMTPYRDWPGVRGASGHVSMTPTGGEAVLDMHDGALALPTLFRAPIPVERAAARVRWQRQSEHWLVVSDNITFANDDARATAKLSFRLPHDTAQSPYMALSVDFRDANARNASRYYPVRHLSPQTLAWMERSFGGGVASQGTVVYDGRTRDFPFDDGSGKFEIRVKVRDGVYRYLPGWEPITAANADVLVQGERFLITGNGRVGALNVNEVVVSNVEAGSVRVRANVAGPTAETVRVLREVDADPKTTTWKEWLPPALQAAGDGTLSLDLNVPVGDRTTTMRGEYRFAKGTLRYAGVPDVGNLSGRLNFTEEGIYQGVLNGRWFDEPTVIAISSPRINETVVVAQGRLTAAGLAPLFGPRLAPRVAGVAPWEARLRLAKGRRDVSGEMDLSGIALSMPAPLNGTKLDKLVVRTEASARDSLTLNVSAGELVQGRVRYVNDDGWRVQTGRIFFNEMPARISADMLASADRGVHLFLRLGEFSLDEWIELLDDGRSTETPAWLARIGADIRALTLADYDVGPMRADFTHEKDGWSGAINGAAAVGRMRLVTAPATRIDLDLERAVFPSTKPKHPDAETDPRKLPTVMLKTKSFIARDREYGALDFAAYPVAQGWRIERAVFTRPEAQLEASGFWRREPTRSSSQFVMSFSGRDVGKTMEALGVPDQLDGGEAKVIARLSWAGAPGDVAFATLNGTIEVDANKGRFLKVSQGAGRMFGVLDLSALGRYFMLDFSPIFGKGFAFDSIQGKATIERGVAHTQDLHIRGPSAKIGVSGSMGLVAEDFHLVVDVSPSLSSGLTIGSFLYGGPQVAAWTWVVQRLFRKQIEEGMRITYLINGPWSDPKFERKLAEGAETEPAEADTK